MKLPLRRRWQVITQRPSGEVVEGRYWLRSTAAMYCARLTLFVADVYRDRPQDMPDVFVRRDGGGRD